jgi:hypothetical protein
VKGKNNIDHVDESIKKAIDREVSKEVKRIIRETDIDFNKESMDFGNIERELRSKMLKLGGVILERIIKKYGTGYRKSRIKCECGHKKEYIDNREKKCNDISQRSRS